MIHRYVLTLAFFAGACGALLPAGAFAQLSATPMLLVAQPLLQDPLFRKSVVLVTRHGRSRPIGVILNHPKEQAPEPGAGVIASPPYVGGPVSPLSVVVVFQADGRVASNLLALGDEVYLGFGQDLYDDLTQRKPPLARLRVFSGFSTWAKGQLENEIARGSWLPVPFDADVLFRSDTSNIWEELLAKANSRAI